MLPLDFMQKKKRMALILSVLILSVAILVFMGIPAASANHSLIGNPWQGLIEGTKGEGTYLYRLDFVDESQVLITKQQGMDNVYEEAHAWQLQGNEIIISSAAQDQIRDFDEAKLVIEADGAIAFAKGAMTGELNYHDKPLAAVHFVLALVLLLAMNELFRNSKWLGVIMYFVLPFALIPVWASHDITYWFKWVKVYSVVFACIWFTFMRFSSLHNKNFAKIICGSFLAINIMEAVIQDFSMGFLPNYLNGIAGVLNIITLWVGWKFISSDDSEMKDMIWKGMPLLWIIAYDVWNWTYVYLNFPGSIAFQTMVILSCTSPCIFIKKGTWLQARAYTLAAWFMYYFTFPTFTEAQEGIFPRTEGIMLFAASLSIALNILYFAAYVRVLKKEKTLNPAGLEMQPDLSFGFKW